MSSAKPKATTSQTVSDASAEPLPFAGEPINPDPSPADLQRRRETKRAWSSYRGEFPEVFKTEQGQPSANIRANRCASIVDKGVSWLMGKAITLSVRRADADGTPDDGQDTNDPNTLEGQQADAASADESKQLEAALQQVWGNEDDMMTLLTSVAMNGAVAGHAYLKIVWDSQKMRYPRFSALDSQNVYVLTDPDDCNRAVAYVIEYRASMGLTSSGQSRVITKRQVIALVDPDGNARLLGGEDDDDTWTITNYQRVEQDGADVGRAPLNAQQSQWRQLGAPTVWPYPFPPIVDAMNLPNPNEYYGLSDLPPAIIDMNERLHFIESNIATIIKSHAHPWVFASGCDPSAIQNTPGVVQGLPSTESKVWAVSASGDLEASMKFAENLRADMDEQSRVPAVALGRQESLPKGNLSGVALELLFQPLLEKTDLKRRLYGQLIRRASAYALTLLGLIDAPRDVEVDISWPTLLPVDDLAAAQTAQALLQVGVSAQRVLEDLGYDYDEEQDKADQDAQRRSLRQLRGQSPLPPQGMQPGMIAQLQAQRAATNSGLAAQMQRTGSVPPQLQGLSLQPGQSGQPGTQGL